mmetsp:Transcript_60011/g.99091  ORF Transcript_60011/g.99091 Transcript_60011/m.99091 type:complete len:261 (-) Transcript_60011:208-990(-)
MAKMDTLSGNEEILKFYSHPVCPFGQRVWMALVAKNIPHQFIECNLRDKEDFFKQAYAKALGADPNSDGKTPIIQTVDGKLITDSLPLVRYLDCAYGDESKDGPPLIPSDPYERVAVELLVDWFGSCGWVKLHYGTLMECDPKQAADKVTEWKKLWQRLNDRLSTFSDKGTYLGGTRLSLFEVTAVPFFERLVVVQYYAKLEILTKWMDEFPRIKDWYATVTKTEAFQKTAQKPQYLIDAYKSYRVRGEEKYKKEQAQLQ